MMNRFFTLLLAASCLTAAVQGVWSQTSINETDFVSACAGVVTDSGGSGVGYAPNEFESITICPPPGEETVWIEWQVFDLDATSQISVYDGNTMLSLPLGQGTNDELAGSVFVATAFNVSGCLTVTFVSGEGPDVGGDFAFSINCGQPCDAPAFEFAASYTNPSCYFTDGTIEVDLLTAFGDNQGPFTAEIYEEDPVTGSLLQIANTTWVDNSTFGIYDLSPGRYIVVVANAYGCSYMQNFDLEAPPPLTLSVPPAQIICLGASALIEVESPQDDNFSFTYVWNNGLPNGPVQQVSPTVSTMYSVQGYDPAGCPTPVYSVNVYVYDALETDLTTSSDFLCIGQEVNLDASASYGGSGTGYTYEWSFEGITLNEYADEITLTPPSSGTYCVTVNDDCETPPSQACVEIVLETPPLGFCDCSGNQPDAIGVCGGNCLEDDNNNGVCDNAEFFGCTYSFSPNYDPDATMDDGSCESPCSSLACGLQYDGNADGAVGSGDLLGLLTEFGSVCELEVALACGDAVSYQGYDYATVLIGEQCWFAENLRSENYENGDAIPSNLSDSDWQQTTSGVVTVYGEGSSDCWNESPDGDACDEAWSLNEYGLLYNYYAVDDARGLCPSGWNVPTDGEWTQLTDFLGGATYAGSSMKASPDDSPGWSGTNQSGFTGLPGGYRDDIGYFDLAGTYGTWWSSSASSDSSAWARSLFSSGIGVIVGTGNQRYGLSVRCIKDTE